MTKGDGEDGHRKDHVATASAGESPYYQEDCDNHECDTSKVLSLVRLLHALVMAQIQRRHDGFNPGRAARATREVAEKLPW